jgi:hypothetical protein
MIEYASEGMGHAKQKIRPRETAKALTCDSFLLTLDMQYGSHASISIQHQLVAYQAIV